MEGAYVGLHQRYAFRQRGCNRTKLVPVGGWSDAQRQVVSQPAKSRVGEIDRQNFCSHLGHDNSKPAIPAGKLQDPASFKDCHFVQMRGYLQGVHVLRAPVVFFCHEVLGFVVGVFEGDFMLGLGRQRVCHQTRNAVLNGILRRTFCTTKCCLDQTDFSALAFLSNNKLSSVSTAPQ